MQKITPFLWFDDKAEETAKFYVSVFKNSKLGAVSRYGESAAQASGRQAGSVMTVEFELDRVWEKLCAGGEKVQCGWLKDKFGLSWQVVPSVLPKLMQGKKADKVMAAILTMKKLDIAALERAAA